MEMNSFLKGMIGAVEDSETELLMLNRVINDMQNKLEKARVAKGRNGWHLPDECSNRLLLGKLKDNLNDGVTLDNDDKWKNISNDELIDVLNLAAMMYCRNLMYGEEKA